MIANTSQSWFSSVTSLGIQAIITSQTNTTCSVYMAEPPGNQSHGQAEVENYHGCLLDSNCPPLKTEVNADLELCRQKLNVFLSMNCWIPNQTSEGSKHME